MKRSAWGVTGSVPFMLAMKVGGLQGAAAA
jgi:hypothetical protein